MAKRRKREDNPLAIKKLDKSADNVADQMDDDQKKKVADLVVDGFERDERSCADRRTRQAFWRMQYSGNMPRPSKKRGEYTCTAHLPVLTVPVMQFRSRAREYLLPSRGVARCKGTGAEDAPRAERSGNALQFFIEKKTRFRQVFDGALLPTAIDGSNFLKVRWSNGAPDIASVPAEDFVVSYTHSGTIEDAARVTHRLRMSRDTIRKRINDGSFCEEGWDLGAPERRDGGGLGDIRQKMDGHSPQPDDPDRPREVLEQYRNLDLDGDGIGEPYVVTVDRESRTLLRVVSREINGEVLNPWVMLPFEPSPESFYPLGMGHLLEGIGVVADSAIQQLVDWGSRAINPPGFVSKRAFKKPGEVTYELGTLIELDGPVSDLKDHIMFLPIPGQPGTMAETLQLVLSEANRIASVTDIMQGLSQPTNQTATTSLVLSKQSLALFNSVFNRLRDAMTEVLVKMFQLCRLYLDDATYSALLGDTGQPEYRAWEMAMEAFVAWTAQVQTMLQQGAPPEAVQMALMQQPPMPPEYPFSVQEDFADTIDVFPTADPEVTSEVERLTIAEKTFALVTQNPAVPATPQTAYAALRRVLEAMRVSNIDELVTPPEPGPPPNLDQTEELANLLEGKPMFVLPEQDHVAHLQVIAAFMEKDGGWWVEQLDPAQKDALQRHQKEHMAWILRAEAAQGGMNAGPNMGPAGAPAPVGVGDGGMGGLGGMPMGEMAAGEPDGGVGASPQLIGTIAANLGRAGAGDLAGA